jgi:hypothetical protein
MKTLGVMCWSITFLVAALYGVVTVCHLATNTKWILFGLHLTLAVTGLVISVIAALKRQYWCLGAAAISLFFLWLQFGSLLSPL